MEGVREKRPRSSSSSSSSDWGYIRKKRPWLSSSSDRGSIPKKRPRLSSVPKKRRPSSSDWASLPEELLDLILHRLIQTTDYLHFAAVCKLWLSVANHQKDHRRREFHKHVVPMLLIPPPPTAEELNRFYVPVVGEKPPLPPPPRAAVEDVDYRRRLYSVTQNKVLNMYLRAPYHARFCGSSYGWLAFVNFQDYGISLLNPFSGKSLWFPHANHEVSRSFAGFYGNFDYTISKVVLSCDPSLMPNDFVVLAIFGGSGDVCFIKPGDKRWTYVQGHSTFMDAIYHLGKFYVADYYGGVLSIDVSKSNPELTQVAVGTRIPTEPGYNCMPLIRRYIVESSSGRDLWLVKRFLKQRRRSHDVVTSDFKIFKLLGNGDDIAEAVEINSLGHDALFLGDNHSLAVLAPNFSGCRPNCIYYTHDCTLCYDIYCPYGPRDAGMFSLEDRSIVPHYLISEKPRRMPVPPPMHPPIWILPTLL